MQVSMSVTIRSTSEFLVLFLFFALHELDIYYFRMMTNTSLLGPKPPKYD
jgi:hypothetical protein